MSTTLSNLTESIKILETLRIENAGIDYAWLILQHAGKHLQKQVTAHFAE